MPHSSRPRLRTTHPLVDRGPGEVQLGLGDGALLLSGLPRVLRDCLGRLDGAVTLAELESDCARAGTPAAALERLLDILDDAGALDRGATGPRGTHRDVRAEDVDGLVALGFDDRTARARLPRPGRARVVVLGRGSLSDAVASALDPVVGRVEVLSPELPAHGADLVVLVARPALDPIVAGRAALSGQPLLPVVTDGHGVVVGPWHSGPGDPCPDCLDLRRADADDAWPSVLHRLTRPMSDGRPAPAETDAVTTALAAAVTTHWVRRRLVGLLDTPGLTCEVDPWQLGLVHRVWPVHPRCAHHERAEQVGA